MAPRKAPEKAILTHGNEAAPPKAAPPKPQPAPVVVERKSIEQQIGEAHTAVMRANGLGRRDLKRYEAYNNMVMRAARARYGWFNEAFPPGSSV